MLGFNKKKTLKVRLLGDSILAAKAKRIETIDEEVRELSEAMLRCMYDNDGIGLAGNQVGIPLQILTLHIDPPHTEDGKPLPLSSPGEMELLPKMPLTFLNPEIVSTSSNLETNEEGCLSVPKIYAPVERPASIVLHAQLLDGSMINLECGGLLARALQHEIDHLNGIVFVQKVKDPHFETILPKLEKQIKKSGKKNFKVKRLV